MAFDPSTLFGSGEAGVVYDVQTLSSMFQDSAGTTPAVVDSPVGRLNDVSGNTHHAVQATSGLRPILRHDYSGYYLEFDGVDDYLRAAFTIAQPWSRLSLIDPRAWVSSEHILSGATSFAGALIKHAQTPALNIYSGAFFPTDTNALYSPGGVTVARVVENVPTVVVEVHNGASSQLGVNQDPVATGNAGTTLPGGITLGATYLNAAGHVRVYGVIEINRALTATETENAQGWLTRQSARVLAVDGDSNTSAAPISYAYQYVSHASPAVYLQNLAVPGTGFDTNGGDLVLRLAAIDARIPAAKNGRQYVYFPWWSNNAPTSANYLTPLVNRTQAQFAADVATFLRARKAAGWDKVGIGTLLERTDAQDNTATRAAYNTILRAPGWIQANGIDFLVDFAADSVMGAAGMSLDASLCSDGVHFTTLGHANLEVIFRAVLNAVPATRTHHRGFRRGL